MAPEIASASGAEISPRTDVYLLGATLHEAVMGRAPHKGGPAIDRMMRAYQSEPIAYPPSVPEVAPEVAIDHPELVAGTRDRIDTSIMKALPGRIISKGGMEALRGVAILPGPRTKSQSAAASGMAIKIEDGDGFDRGTWAATIEALAQAGALDGQPLRVLSRYHRPITADPHGRPAAEAVASFELAPLGELLR